MRWLDGKKSYLGALALFVVGGLVYLGILDEKTGQALLTALAGWGLYALKDAVRKAE